MVACFFGITGHVTTAPLEHRRIVHSVWYTTICLPKVCVEIRKTNKRRRTIVHNDNARPCISAQTSAFWTVQIVALTWPRMTSFYSSIQAKNVNDCRRQKMLLKRSKTMFWGVFQPEWKNKHNDGVCQKWQHFQWKCQIASGNTRNMLGQKFV